MIPVVIRHRAEADLERARAWYAHDDHRLGAAFVEEFDLTVQRISALPDQFPEVGREVRRALLHRFPYATYFVRRADIAICRCGSSSASQTRREAARPSRGSGLTQG
jgi:plasmid stabilization system protein ParE